MSGRQSNTKAGVTGVRTSLVVLRGTHLGHARGALGNIKMLTTQVFGPGGRMIHFREKIVNLRAACVVMGL